MRCRSMVLSAWRPGAWLWTGARPQLDTPDAPLGMRMTWPLRGSTNTFSSSVLEGPSRLAAGTFCCGAARVAAALRGAVVGPCTFSCRRSGTPATSPAGTVPRPDGCPGRSPTAWPVTACAGCVSCTMTRTGHPRLASICAGCVVNACVGVWVCVCGRVRGRRGSGRNERGGCRGVIGVGGTTSTAGSQRPVQ